ncbi:MAG: orotate phosphoribosyltransferase [Saprospiraceae bacterium]
MDIAAEVARNLLNINAVKLQPERTFYLGFRYAFPDLLRQQNSTVPSGGPHVSEKLPGRIIPRFCAFDVVAGVATAGIPHGALLADLLEKPFIYVRSSAKDHGRRNRIEGLLWPGQRVLVIEDLISTGGSCLLAAEALQEAGAEVAGVLAIFQYGFAKADAAFSSKGIDFQTLTNYDTLIQEAVKSGYIPAEDLNTLKKWRENPDGWGALYA